MEDGNVFYWFGGERCSIFSEAKQSFAAVRSQTEFGTEEDRSILDPPSSILGPPSSILYPLPSILYLRS
jgi:hypothetical protein